MAEVTEAAAEVVAEVAEDVAEQAATLAGVTGRDMGLVFFGSCVGLTGGLVIGYLWARKRLETKYSQLAEEEIDGMREHFQSKLMVAEGKPALATVVNNLGYVPPPEERPDPEIEERLAQEGLNPGVPVQPELRNVFENQVEDNWDMAAEIAARAPEQPYVIHVDERHETEYDESTLTYYAADDVLCDEQDKVIDNRELVVGDGNLDKFGHGSNDPNIVYVRNDQLCVEVEVVKSDNSYAEEVHGLRHSDPGRQRRPGWDDD